jgi:hypothetical protein
MSKQKLASITFLHFNFANRGTGISEATNANEIERPLYDWELKAICNGDGKMLQPKSCEFPYFYNRCFSFEFVTI